MGLPRGSQIYIGLYRENMKKIFLSETTETRALIFDMKHLLVDLYHVCSNYTPGGQNGTAVWGGGSHV